VVVLCPYGSLVLPLKRSAIGTALSLITYLLSSRCSSDAGIRHLLIPGPRSGREMLAIDVCREVRVGSLLPHFAILQESDPIGLWDRR